MKTALRILTTVVSCIAIVSCAGHVDQPQGTSKGYTSARLVAPNPKLPAPTTAMERQVHSMIQKSISKEFAAKGLAYGKADAELVVAYLVIYQEPGMTADYPYFFGEGRSHEEIAKLVHNRGAVDNERPDYFRQAGLVVDVIDSRTNKLVYRGFAKNDVVRGASDSNRAARIDAAVAEALAPFFK